MLSLSVGNDAARNEEIDMTTITKQKEEICRIKVQTTARLNVQSDSFGDQVDCSISLDDGQTCLIHTNREDAEYIGEWLDADERVTSYDIY